MKKTTLLLCSLLITGTTISASLPASAAPRTPKAGSSERKALMNALRPKLGATKGKALITPSHIKVERGWAYIEGGWAYANGVLLEEQFQDGPGTNFSALLHFEKGKWRVKRFVYAGDVQAPEAMQEFPRAPRSIFPRY